MLKLKGITKIYDVADEKVVALSSVNIRFRRSEFVSILGPSGCGKTTLLNIIGGLDRYTSGDMFVDGVSTAEYGDRDWDSYRNHSVGFVFQNYNLIQHLSVLANVELALTLIGVDKEKRERMALEALERVGLRNKAYKKPNQLSGGQMQRVAIARALINDPDIILADEPTGALDSETSVQIMEILKEISKRKLVIMVTHNGELAKTYSTRIVRLFDGKLVGDTMPYKGEDKKRVNVQAEEAVEDEPLEGQVSAIRIVNGVMSDNVMPITEAEAGSSVKTYTHVYEGRRWLVFTTRSGKIICPYNARNKKYRKGVLIAKKATSAKEDALVSRYYVKKEKSRRADERVKRLSNKPAMKFATALKLSFTNLSMKRFRTFLTSLAGSIGILGIGLVLAFHSGLTGFIDRQEVALSSYPITITRNAADLESMVSTVVSSLDSLGGKYEKDKVYVYKIVTQILKNKNHVNVFDREMIEAIRAIDEDLYYDIYENYGLNFNAVRKIPNKTKIFGQIETQSQMYLAIDTSAYWSQLPARELVEEQYELIAGSYPTSYDQLVLILDGKNQISDINLFFNGLNMESVTLNYKEDEEEEGLTMEVADFVGQEFKLVHNDAYYLEGTTTKNETTSPKGTLSIINKEIAERVGSGYQIRFFRGDNKDDTNISYTYDDMRGRSETLTVSGVIKLKDDVSVGVLGNKAIGYTSALNDRVIQLAGQSTIVKNKLQENPGWTDEEITANLKQFGYSVIPSSISIYCKNYDSKSMVKAALDDISADRKAVGKSEIVYTDIMSIVLNIVQKFIQIITYSLLALTAISLIVSALMIGIITYVSVLERTREIGVLRALGARKKDISRIFNAETLIIGFVSGALGIIITYVASWPLGAVMAQLTAIKRLVALPWYYAVVLVVVSSLLTFIAGLIPAGIAKRKDPVKALRAE